MNEIFESNDPSQERKPQTPKKRKKTPRKINERYLRNSGLFYLQRFTTSSGHFKTVMSRKIKKSCYFHKDQDYDECITILDKIITEFLDQGLLDDAGYLRGMVTSLRRSGKSKKAIMAKLMQKSIPAHDIEKALETYDQDTYDDPREAEFLAAITFARKKHLGPYDERNKYEDEKALNMLARNGYGYDTARRVLNLSEDDLYELGYKLY